MAWRRSMAVENESSSKVDLERLELPAGAAVRGYPGVTTGEGIPDEVPGAGLNPGPHAPAMNLNVEIGAVCDGLSHRRFNTGFQPTVANVCVSIFH
jgi:hypothetical protein